MPKQQQTLNSKQADAVSDTAPSFWRLLFLLLFVAALIAIAFYAEAVLGFSWKEFYAMLPAAIRDMGLWGKFTIIGLMIAHSFIPFPAEFLAIIAGSTYGVIEGTILIWIGAMLGACISFALTRTFGRPFLEWMLPEKQRGLLDKWAEDQGAFTLLISRFIPVIAFNLINYAAGLTRVSWWTFIWTTAIGILPLTAFMVYMGETMQHLSLVHLILVSAICILLMLALSYYRTKTR